MPFINVKLNCHSLMPNSECQAQNSEDETCEFWVKEIIMNHEGQEWLRARTLI